MCKSFYKIQKKFHQVEFSSELLPHEIGPRIIEIKTVSKIFHKIADGPSEYDELLSMFVF